jgi:hypothetical protein
MYLTGSTISAAVSSKDCVLVAAAVSRTVAKDVFLVLLDSTVISCKYYK